jgi:CheY-like chemotaxis protein
MHSTIVVTAVSDLLTLSRIRGLAHQWQAAVVSAQDWLARPEAFPGEANVLVVVDLEAKEPAAFPFLERLQRQPGRKRLSVLAFGPHVRTELLQAAQALGADHVVARRRLFDELQRLLEQARKDPRP